MGYKCESWLRRKYSEGRIHTTLIDQNARWCTRAIGYWTGAVMLKSPTNDLSTDQPTDGHSGLYQSLARDLINVWTLFSRGFVILTCDTALWFSFHFVRLHLIFCPWRTIFVSDFEVAVIRSVSVCLSKTSFLWNQTSEFYETLLVLFTGQ